MTKRILALAAAAALILCLVGCTAEFTPPAQPAPQSEPQTQQPAAPEPQAEPTPEPQTIENKQPTSNELWSSLGGVWVCTEPGDWQYFFLMFNSSTDPLSFTEGILASDYGRTAQLKELKSVGENEYELTLFFPAVAETEMYSGMDERTDVVRLNVAGAAEKSISITRADGEIVWFDMLGDTLEQAFTSIQGE